MATNFPSSLDNFTNPVSGNTLDSPSHSLQHSDANDAIEAIEAKLGVGNSPAGSATAGQVLTISAAGTSGWSTPTRDGLVQVIATSVAVGSGSGSVDANGNVTFSGASSVSLNGCFTSTYQNYKILISDVIGSTTAQDFNLRLRKSGTDNTSNIYNFQYTRTAGPTYTGGRILTTSFGIGAVISTGTNNFVLDIFSPNIATTKTGMNCISSQGATNDIIILQYVHTHDLATSADFDGFTIFPASGTISGVVRVYGFRN